MGGATGQVLAIDVDRSRRAVRTWTAWSDELDRSRLGAAGELGDVGLAGVASTALGRWASGSAELAAAALFLQLVVDQVEAADALRLPAGLDQSFVERLLAFARSAVRTPSNACVAVTFPVPPLDGDLGGTYDGEVREPYLLGADPAVELGREFVLRATRDTASGLIRADEFLVVRLADGLYGVVLPGVTDLSEPNLGLDPMHRSVRDLDQFAYPSSRSSRVDDNRYAQMVAEALAVRGVPLGSDLVIVGHSYGADTALDLAADDDFNSDRGYHITHVAALGYHSSPQLPDVRPGTQVLVVQNRRDAAIVAEAIGHGHVVEGIEARRDLLDGLVGLDPIGTLTSAGRMTYHDVGAAISAIEHTVERTPDLFEIAVGAAVHQPRMVLDGATDFVTLRPGVDRPRDGQVVAVFDGGGDGFGHDQSNYLEYLETVDDPAVTDFLRSLGRDIAGGRGGGPDVPTTGSAWAIDVSVP
jgi:hypothetical protein